jgi:hypothetical protein
MPERRLTQVRPCSSHISRGLTKLAQFYVVHLAQARAKFVNVKNGVDG